MSDAVFLKFSSLSEQKMTILCCPDLFFFFSSFNITYESAVLISISLLLIPDIFLSFEFCIRS